MALPLNHDVDAAIAKPPPFSGNALDGVAQLNVINANRLIAHRRAIHLQDIARPPLAHLMFSVQMSHCFPHGGGRYHFFAFTSLNIALSNICSASSFFSLAFSDSNALSFFASDGSMPPYFDL